jgi:hypothetical protein
MNMTRVLSGQKFRAGSICKSCSAVWLILLLFGLLLSTSAWSQPNAPDSMPPWTVLVLKLVSATHVQPTTGIVIAAPDQVLVALDFARVGDEIMVLDGGTDIVRHGRPASIVHTLPADGLAILKVQGLNRPAAQLSAASMASLQTLNLVAFPPAEKIAEGAAPVRASVKTLAAITTARPTLEPFANVSAALTDNCGGLVAFNLPSGVQSMEPAGSPKLAWADALKRAAELTGTALQQQDCSAAQSAAQEPAAEPTEPEEAENPAPEPEPEPDSEPEPEAEAPAESESSQAEEAPQPEDAAGEEQAELAEEEIADAAATGLQEDSTVGEITGGDGNISGPNPAQPRRLSVAGWIFASLALLLVLGWWLYRQRQKLPGSGAPQPTDLTAEPGTVLFAGSGMSSAAVRLKVAGHRPDGEGFSRQLPVSGPGWMAELGRQEADIDLDSPTVSRRHARLELYEGRITITDLDSTNGTRVNGVSCLPGEVFFVQADDVVELGDVELSLQLATGEDQ